MSRKGQSSPRTITQGLRQRAWWVLRNRKEATIPQLLFTLADGEQKDASSNLGKYLGALEKARILGRSATRVPGTSITSNGHVRYLLLIDCGIAAPVWRVSRNEVYAPDSGETYPIQEKSND